MAKKKKKNSRRARRARREQDAAMPPEGAAPPEPALPKPAPLKAPSRQPLSEVPWYAWAAVALLAVSLRALYFVEHSASPFFHGLLLDAANYDALGWKIASGGGLWDGVLTFNPLETLILAVIYSIGGHDLAWPRLIQLAADVAMVAGVSVTAGRMICPRAGLIAGVLAAVYGPSIFYAGELLAECWSLSFLALSLASLTGRRWPWRLLSGVLMGLATLGRPNLVLLYPVLAAWWCLTERVSGLRRIAPMFIGMFFVIAPITAKNLAAGDPVMITAHGGINLFIGNNPDASGWFKIPRGTGLAASQQELIASAERHAEAERGRELRPSEVSDYWRERAVEFFTRYPVTSLKLMLRKSFYFLNGYEKPMVANYYFAKQSSVVLSWLTVGLAPVMILGGLGMVLGWSDRRRLAPLYLLVLTYAAGVVLFFVSMRYRLPVVAGLLPFAGLAVDRMLRKRPGLPVVAAGILLSVVVLWPSVRHAELPAAMAHTHYYLGSIALQDDDSDAAIGHFTEALVSAPGNPRYAHQQGVAFYRSGRLDEAIVVLEAVTADEPIFLPPYITLGIAYRKTGNLAAAESTYRRAIKVSDRYPFAWYNLGNVLIDLRRPDEAVAAFEETLRLKPGFTPAEEGLKRVRP
ncbi:MAG: tetratricopeptide repeat protein [Myxococcota bacterium]|nr:tetratricopeptide repeat protein [Myxococcota bacterium]